jgi:hypothetical protein
MKLRNFIAQRELLYSLKGDSHRRLLVVRVSAPYLIDRDTAGFSADTGSAACTVEFDGIEIGAIEVNGIDPLHALSLAIDVDAYLKGMKDRYEFYWATGEPYFEDAV